MNHNPVFDAIDFLQQPGWITLVFWILAAAGIVVAVYAFSTIRSQRSFPHVCNWAFRFLIGCMWWQQTLWKLPPLYTDHPDQPFGATGLAYWMGVMGKAAAVPLQADLVNNVVLPHFYLFAPIVYALEALTAVSLILGIFVRLWGLIGALQILNLWLGLYNAEGEWPWTYFFLLVLQLIFALHHYGRSLGLDAVLVARSQESPRHRRILLAALA
ncbi:MAG: DoxX family protein [Alphaproteobacteria bacterium]|nr:DoxX family protein [Alphaproteobacteria bacterium]